MALLYIGIMAIYKAQGIVCSSTKLNEADRIVHIYTDNGLIKGVAKGIRKTKSKFGGRLEPLSFVDLVLYKGKTLDTITQVDLIDPFSAVKGDFKKLSFCLAIADFIQKMTEHESHPGELFNLFRRALEKISTDPDIEKVYLLFTLKALQIIGYDLDFRSCIHCGSGNMLVNFSARQGGMICSKCIDADLASAENKAAAYVLTSLIKGQPKSSSREDLHSAIRLINSFIKHHIDISLRSFRFIDRILMDH